MSGSPGPSARRPPLCDLVVEGRLDQEVALQMREYVLEVLQKRPVIVLIDVSAVHQVTASGVAGLLELLRLTRDRGGDVRLHGHSQAVVAAHAATRLALVSPVYASRELAALAGQRTTTTVVSWPGRAAAGSGRVRWSPRLGPGTR
ncbi:STAS domain-containing protein [Spongisporangium articulatum]|uniref:STAS domain-containing protein n=1 Tax=Spongisporangium articulatum TaxID=3362603 RepID=A0ABW8AL29_9ACTN